MWVLIMYFLSPAGRPAQTPLPGSGWYPGSSCRRAWAGVCSQLSAPLFPRRIEMDHLEGPLGQGSKRGLFVLLIAIELEPAVPFMCTQIKKSDNLNVIK